MAVFLRATIMLVCLVGIPAAWVYYGPLPEGGQQLVDRAMRFAADAWNDAVGTNNHSEPIAAPRFGGASDPTIALASNTAAIATQTQPATETGGGFSHLEPLLGELRNWGAAEYALENWGTSGSLFRFRCEMPLVDGDAATRQFEAIGPDTHAAVRQVVAEVSAWRQARAGYSLAR